MASLHVRCVPECPEYAILGFARKFEAKIETAIAFIERVEELGKSIDVHPLAEKKSMIEEFYGRPRPVGIDVHPPNVVRTKELCSRKVSRKEAAIKKMNKPLRRCAKCNELGHHDSRNCDSQGKGKGKGKEKV